MKTAATRRRPLPLPLPWRGRSDRTPVSTSPRPTLFALPGLGLDGRAFDALRRELAEVADLVALDLPGDSGTSLEALTAATIRRIRDHGASRWLLLGHSMGGKIASLVASRTMTGRSGLFGLAGVVLLAGSPLSPEPMAEERRSTMLGWVDDGPLDQAQAREFVDQNVGSPLPVDTDAEALAELRRYSPEGWRDWLEHGSREDRTAEAALDAAPALLIAGGEDGDLGTDAQARLNGSLYSRGRLLTLAGAGHLLPFERPAEVASAIRRFWEEEAGVAPVVPADVGAVIASARTSTRVRGLLAVRALADDPEYAPRALTAVQLIDLRAIAGRVVPQEGGQIDLAARVDTQLANGEGDGWRNADLPADPVAYGLALDTLRGFADLGADEQDAQLRAVADGTATPGQVSARQLTAWFEDCRVDLVKQWLAHPASMARIGYDGYASGGDTRALVTGFRLLGADDRESWEPTTRSHR
ncbi:hypothetical protein C5C18_07130 [Rathayibacter tritici]|nr:hypothetical protein C5C06_11470 [Rathayibacter tritici]PPG07565.1 hypothetical protein C5C18_07130 [Rathayibacter tritici]PPI17382.1 hypothetical protein C5D07_05025 [Rathayibacter tritici]